MDALKLEPAITKHTACIMPVHLGGSAADMDTILSVAGRHRLPVLEDACQAHFCEWRGKKVSTIGDLGCFAPSHFVVDPAGAVYLVGNAPCGFPITAGAFLTMIVPLAVFLLLQRAFVRGILAGSVKS